MCFATSTTVPSLIPSSFTLFLISPSPLSYLILLILLFSFLQLTGFIPINTILSHSTIPDQREREGERERERDLESYKHGQNNRIHFILSYFTVPILSQQDFFQLFFPPNFLSFHLVNS